MALPIQLESIAAAQARYPAAMKRRWDVSRMQDHPEERPGRCRDQVFDLEWLGRRIRLIVSIDVLQGDLVLHVSGSFADSSGLDEASRIQHILSAWAEISGAPHMEATGIHKLSPGKVHHFMFPLGQSLEQLARVLR